MDTTRKRVYTLRVDGDKLDLLGDIAALEHRSAAQKLRAMIDREIAEFRLQDARDDYRRGDTE